MELFAACGGNEGAQERDDRTLFNKNRRKLRRAQSDRYRSYNFSNYTQGETIEEVNEDAQGFEGKYYHDNYRNK